MHAMDETRRFLRYVVPTLVFMTEVSLLLLLTQKGCLIGGVSSKLKTGGAGFAALLLVMAGGLGYLFSLLHHTCFWCCEKYGIDYREFVKTAGWLKLVDYRDRTDVAKERVTSVVAWDVVTLIWYRPGKAGDTKDPELGEMRVHRTDAMSDLMHGLGTSVIAAVFVWFTWACLYFWLCHEPLPSSNLVRLWHVLLTVSLAGLFIWVHFSNYRRVRNHLSRLVKSTPATHFADVGKAHEIFVDRSALESDQGTTRSPLRRLGTAIRQGVERVCKRSSPVNKS
jgi:hypothetical protein